MKTIEENLGFCNEIIFIWSLHRRSKDGAVGVFAQYVNWKIAKNKPGRIKYDESEML